MLKKNGMKFPCKSNLSVFICGWNMNFKTLSIRCNSTEEQSRHDRSLYLLQDYYP